MTAWIKPNKPIREKPEALSAWAYPLQVLLALFVGIVVGLIAAVQPQPDFKLALELGMLAAVISLFGLTGVYCFKQERPWLKLTIWNTLRSAELFEWHQRLNRHLVLLARHALIPEPLAAPRMLGLEPNPPRAESAKQVLYTEPTLAFASTRFEKICNDLLSPLHPKLVELKNIHVWWQSTPALTEVEHALFMQCWQRLSLPKPLKVQVLPDDQTVGEIQNSWLNSKCVHLVLAVQYHRDEDTTFPECAIALLLAPDHLAAQHKNKTRCQLFCPMSSHSETMSADLHAWLHAEQQDKDQVKNIWQGNLSMGNRHALETQVQDLALNLRQTPPAFGMLNINQSLGEFGACAPWLMVSMAAEMAITHQGAQGVVSEEKNDVLTLQMISVNPAAAYPWNEGHCDEVLPMSFLFLGLFIFSLSAVLWFGVIKAFDYSAWFMAFEIVVLFLSITAIFGYRSLVEHSVLDEFNRH